MRRFRTDRANSRGAFAPDPATRARPRRTSRNLAAGQTGLSIAFDLSTQGGHDAEPCRDGGPGGRKIGLPSPRSSAGNLMKVQPNHRVAQVEHLQSSIGRFEAACARAAR